MKKCKLVSSSSRLQNLTDSNQMWPSFTGSYRQLWHRHWKAWGNGVPCLWICCINFTIRESVDHHYKPSTNIKLFFLSWPVYSDYDCFESLLEQDFCRLVELKFWVLDLYSYLSRVLDTKDKTRTLRLWGVYVPIFPILNRI